MLNYSRSLPPTVLEDARLEAGTPVCDPNGDVLFVRFPLLKNGVSSGYADIAAHTALGAPLLSLAPAAVWNEQTVLAQGREAFLAHVRGASKKGHTPAYDEVRFVAYSFPKIALQFLREKKEVDMLECFTWIPVPPAAERPERKKLEPANFERWSLD